MNGDPQNSSAAMTVLLDKKMEFLSAYANISMLWWVSSVVFCASLIGGVWLYKPRILALTKLEFHTFAGIVTVFFTSIVLYGILTVVFADVLHKETVRIINQLGMEEHKVSEYVTVRTLVAIGSTSFVLILAVWIILWRAMAREMARMRRSTGTRQSGE